MLCRRSDVQRVLSDFWSAHKARISRYAAAGRYPVNNTVAIRVTGTDTAAQRPSGSDAPPTLSATAPLPGRPELDTVVWLSVLTLPGTADSDPFFAETEAFLRTTMSSYAVVRPEWSKGWAYPRPGPTPTRRRLPRPSRRASGRRGRRPFDPRRARPRPHLCQPPAGPPALTLVEWPVEPRREAG